MGSMGIDEDVSHSIRGSSPMLQVRTLFEAKRVEGEWDRGNVHRRVTKENFKIDFFDCKQQKVCRIISM